MNYFYEAVDNSGQTVLGRIDATNEGEVRQKLLQMGYRPQAVAPNPAASAAPSVMSPYGVPNGSETLTGITPQASMVPQSAATLMPPTGNSAAQNSLAQNTMAPPVNSARTGGIILTGNAARTAARTQVTPANSTGALTGPTSSIGGVGDRDRLFFFQQLAALTKSGISIYAALDNLAPRTPNKNLAMVAHEMAESARNGGRISDIMERYPRIFEDHIVGLVRAGELGGFLDIALSEIALNYEQNLALFKGAWIPKIMATQGLYALALMIPLFHDLFDSLDIVANLRLYLLHEAIILPIAFLIIQGVKFGWNHAQLPQFRYFRDNLTLKMPPFGDLHRQAALAAFIRMLRRLYHAGVGPIHAWEGAMHTASNVVIRDRLATSYDMMQRGATLPDAFAATGLFQGNLEQLLVTGHMSGQVTESLDQIAEYYQERVDEAARKSRFTMFRIGVIALIVLGGLTAAWAMHTYFDAVFNFPKKLFPELENTIAPLR